MIIGVDFDGTIVKHKYPNIGKPKFFALSILRWLSKRHVVVLWTCRQGKFLDDAIRWCNSNDIEFEYINVNTFDRIRAFGGDCRKLSCDILVDDNAGFVFWPWVLVRVLLKEVNLWIKQR